MKNEVVTETPKNLKEQVLNNEWVYLINEDCEIIEIRLINNNFELWFNDRIIKKTKSFKTIEKTTSKLLDCVPLGYTCN